MILIEIIWGTILFIAIILSIAKYRYENGYNKYAISKEKEEKRKKVAQRVRKGQIQWKV